jgi:peptidoglycan/LPS O-acetylase OafA/YrhL
MGNAANTAQIPALTGLRAIAASMVFIHHFTMRIKSDEWWVRLGHECYTGVAVFFVLSGFLIQYRYQNQFEHTLKPFLPYLIGRIARVWPLYVILTTITFVVQFIYYGYDLSDISTEVFHWLLSITFIKGFAPDDFIFSGIAQGWSLTVEYAFYLLAPLFILFFKPFWKKILAAIGFVLSGGLCYGTYAYTQSLPIATYWQHAGIYTIFGRLFEFLVGMQLAIWFTSRQNHTKPDGTLPYLTTASGLALILFLWFLSVIRGEAQVAIETLHGLLLHNIVLPLIIASVLAGLLVEASFFKSLLARQELQWLGKASYAFYLIHIGVFQYFLEQRLRFDPLQCFIVLWGIAWLLHQYIEQPLQSLVKRLFVK